MPSVTLSRRGLTSHRLLRIWSIGVRLRVTPVQVPIEAAEKDEEKERRVKQESDFVMTNKKKIVTTYLTMCELFIAKIEE